MHYGRGLQKWPVLFRNGPVEALKFIEYATYKEIKKAEASAKASKIP